MCCKGDPGLPGPPGVSGPAVSYSLCHFSASANTNDTKTHTTVYLGNKLQAIKLLNK